MEAVLGAGSERAAARARCPLWEVGNPGVCVHSPPRSSPEGLMLWWPETESLAPSLPCLPPPPSLLLSPGVVPSSPSCVRTLVSGSAWETPTLRRDEMPRRQSVAGT